MSLSTTAAGTNAAALVSVKNMDRLKMFSPGGLEKLSVLVVEDDPAIQELMVSFISNDPHVAVRAVSTGEEAIEAFREKSYDLVFMDVILPGMLGTLAARDISKLAAERGHWLYLTYVTLSPLDPDDLTLVERGVCDVITKPVLPPSLTARIATIRELESARRYALNMEMRMRSMIEQSIDGFMLFSSDDEVLEANRSAELILSAEPGQLIGRKAQEFIHGEQQKEYEGFNEESSFSVHRQAHPIQLEIYRLDGTKCLIEARFSEVHLPKEGRCLAVAFRDVTEKVEYDNAINYVASHDPLTRLPNRRLMQHRLAQTIQLAKRHNRKMALLFIDLDGFKMVNDTYGHAAGDKVLLEISHRFKGLIRDSDTVCRQGGDEFVVILAEIEGEDDAMDVAKRFSEAACKPVQDQNRLYQVGASIGIASFPDAGEDAETLMRHADMAMYHVKENGKGAVLSFSTAMHEEASRKIQLENALHEALRNKEFVLHYQPQICFKTGQLVGVEALIRWMHEGELIYPDNFIAAAEESGLIVPIGEWACSEAARQIDFWRKKYGWSPSISVNVTANGFTGRLVSHLKAVLEDYRLPENSLALELTESMLATDFDGTLSCMHALQAMGVSISLDDFGTGYSAMAQLRRYPLSALKIDKSFIGNLSDRRDAAIAETVLMIAKSLNMKTVAEGVETREQYEWLKEKGCDVWQGYLASAPKPPDQVVWMYPNEFNLRKQGGKVT
ncbi:diguanylate cyclase [Novimethylophilus kurashikiensis]|uniref:Diguanylate cyclase n=1 Tax=Novimethylophilus kurashikiensis TaxID=1825523 RepID=A0A2R5FC56_9PROT|nr:EAL domain-containing protein [Novimethylophilus kurashikiensis]GBG14513.1 diguanylate cyclase [Novimethylophilus kurashikiensis]